MKKIVFSVLMLSVLGVNVQAQDDPAANYKAAKKSLQRYFDSDQKETVELETARQKIDAAFKTDVLLSDPKKAVGALMTKAEIYTELGKLDEVNAMLAKTQKQAYEPKYNDVGAGALDAAAKLIGNANASKGDKKDAVKYMETAVVLANNAGIKQYEKKEYKAAYASFMSVLNAKKLADANGGSKILDTPEKAQEESYFAALTAYYAEMNPEALVLLTDLAKAGYKPAGNDAGVYNLLATIHTKNKDLDKALAVINEGRKVYPNDSGLLFSEINYYIGQNKLEALEGKLEEAIQKDPNNKSLHYVKGKMYDGLQETYYKDKKDAEAATAFGNAEKYYGTAVEKDPKYFDALYSYGALYYNRAAVLTQVMNKLGMSKAESKQYDELQAKVKDLFAKALPHFQAADAINPKDGNTLVALKEITAKQGDLAKSGEYKKRIEALMGK